MKCEFCHNEFSNKQNLNAHQKKTKYCLKLQGITNDIESYLCESCDKSFTKRFNYERHSKICKKTDMKKIINSQVVKIQLLEQEIFLLKADKKDLQERYDKLSITAVKRPTISTKNIQINNYIKNMQPLLESDIKDNIQYLTLEHHAKGVEGYAEYALEFPFKDKIVCVDTARNKIKYKNDEGDVIEDIGFRKMMVKLCKALKDRSFNLSQEHYESLSGKFTEKELDDFNFMEKAIAISKCANGRENDFCSQIVKMISKGVTVKE